MADRDLTCEEVADAAAAYVLGALDPSTTLAVRRHLATCPAVHVEYADLGGVTPYLAQSVEPLDPPPALRVRLLDAAAADGSGGNIEAIASTRLVAGLRMPWPVQAMAPTPVATRDERRVLRWPRPAALGWIAMGVAVVLIAGLATWNLSLRSELQDAMARAQALRELVAAGAPGGTSVLLTGTAGASGARGIVVLSPNGAGYLAVTGLPAATSGHVYEAWFIRAGQARAAGTFSIGPDGLGVLSTAAPAGSPDLVAVTQEPAGGSAQPTGAVLLSGAPDS